MIKLLDGGDVTDLDYTDYSVFADTMLNKLIYFRKDDDWDDDAAASERRFGCNAFQCTHTHVAAYRLEDKLLKGLEHQKARSTVAEQLGDLLTSLGTTLGTGSICGECSRSIGHQSTFNFAMGIMSDGTRIVQGRLTTDWGVDGSNPNGLTPPTSDYGWRWFSSWITQFGTSDAH